MRTEQAGASSRWRAVSTVAGAAAGNFISSQPVLIGTFGVFLLPVSEALGWSRTSFSALLLLLSGVGLAGYPLAGRWADKWGARNVLLIGNVLFAATVFGFSAFSGRYAVTYSLFALASLAGCFSSTVVLNKLLVDRLQRRLGLAFGVTAGGGVALGYVLLPLVVQHVITDSGWRTAYRILALLILVIGQLSLWLLIPRDTARPYVPSEAPERRGPARRALRSPTFWFILVSMCIASAAVSALVVDNIAMAADRSVAPQIAVLTLSAGAAANAVWQPIAGALLDRALRPRFMAPFMLVAIIGVYWLSTATSAGGFLVGGALVGVASGTEYGLVPIGLRRYFGVPAFAEIYGLVFAASLVSNTAGPMILSGIYDLTGSYQLGVRMIWVALGLAGIVIFCLPRFDEIAAADPERVRRTFWRGAL